MFKLKNNISFTLHFRVHFLFVLLIFSSTVRFPLTVGRIKIRNGQNEGSEFKFQSGNVFLINFLVNNLL